VVSLLLPKHGASVAPKINDHKSVRFIQMIGSFVGAVITDLERGG
jgi:hypothetical protein